MLISHEHHKISSALRFEFSTSNNEAEYEALIVGLRMAAEVKADYIDIYNDSLLVVNQVKGEYQAKDPCMAKYLAIVQVELA